MLQLQMKCWRGLGEQQRWVDELKYLFTQARTERKNLVGKAKKIKNLIFLN